MIQMDSNLNFIIYFEPHFKSGTNLQFTFSQIFMSLSIYYNAFHLELAVE